MRFGGAAPQHVDEGRGTLAHFGLTGENASPRILYMATLGKAAGVAGAFVAGSEVLVEYDKLIDRQLERAAITSISGFAKVFQPASKVLQIGTAGGEG